MIDQRDDGAFLNLYSQKSLPFAVTDVDNKQTCTIRMILLQYYSLHMDDLKSLA
jgi:hypothetical protein